MSPSLLSTLALNQRLHMLFPSYPEDQTRASLINPFVITALSTW